MNKLINLVQIDQSNMSSALQTRVLQVRGEVGARFIVNVIKINSTSKESYYNFKTKTFTNPNWWVSSFSYSRQSYSKKSNYT